MSPRTRSVSAWGGPGGGLSGRGLLLGLPDAGPGCRLAGLIPLRLGGTDTLPGLSAGLDDGGVSLGFGRGDSLVSIAAGHAAVGRGNRAGSRRPPLLLPAPVDAHLQPRVERLPHPPGEQGHLAQQPDDFPLTWQGQALPDAGGVCSGGAQLGQQIDLGRVG